MGFSGSTIGGFAGSTRAGAVVMFSSSSTTRKAGGVVVMFSSSVRFSSGTTSTRGIVSLTIVMLTSSTERFTSTFSGSSVLSLCVSGSLGSVIFNMLRFVSSVVLLEKDKFEGRDSFKFKGQLQ